MHNRAIAIASTITIALAGPRCGADVIHVDPDAPGLPTGTSWNNAFRTLGTALAAADDGDEIWIAEGTYTPVAIDQPFAVPPGVALYGGFDGTETARDERDPDAHTTRLSGDLLGDDAPGFANRSDNTTTLLRLETPNAGNLVDGLTLSGGEAANGFPDVYGGAIHATDGSFIVEGCRFEMNRAEWDGGAIRVENGGTVIVRTCVFEHNSAGLDAVAPLGGAIAFSGNELRVEQSDFSENAVIGNTVATGGAIRATGARLRIERCTFTGNRAEGGTNGVGGAVSVRDSPSATFRDCSLTSNTAAAETISSGGGVAITGSTAGFVRCLLDDNEASLDSNTSVGGGLWLGSTEDNPAEVTIVNSRLVSNRAIFQGAIGQTASIPVTLRLAGSVVTGNSAISFPAISISGEMAIINSTIAGNRAITPGATDAAVRCVEGPLTIANSILWANGDDADQSSELLTFGPATITNSCIQGWDGSLGGMGNFSADPLFRDADGDDNVPGTADDDFTPRRFSPCIDAGGNGAIPQDVFDADDDGDTAERLPVDIDGNPRRVDDVDTADTGPGNAPIVDIGAFEFQGRSCPADLDTNGILDLADITAFIAAFPVQDPVADLNGDGLWDLRDVNAFIAIFLDGCAG